jgi:threonyl-tRNA synthetase
VAGDKEVAANQVAVRSLGGKDLGVMSPQAFGERLLAEVASYGRTTMQDG